MRYSDHRGSFIMQTFFINLFEEGPLQLFVLLVILEVEGVLVLVYLNFELHVQRGFQRRMTDFVKNLVF